MMEIIKLWVQLFWLNIHCWGFMYWRARKGMHESCESLGTLRYLTDYKARGPWYQEVWTMFCFIKKAHPKKFFTPVQITKMGNLWCKGVKTALMQKTVNDFKLYQLCKILWSIKFIMNHFLAFLINLWDNHALNIRFSLYLFFVY